jgi:hypothetical protein
MSPSISTTKNPNPKPHPITRRTLLLTAAGAIAATGTGTLWWNSTPHYPTEEHHRIADAIADATDTGPDPLPTQTNPLNITTQTNPLPEPPHSITTESPGTNGTPIANTTPTPLALLYASYLSAPTTGLNIPYTTTGLTQTKEYSRPQMILPHPNQAALANFSAALDATEGHSVIAGHVNYYGETLAPMSLIALLNPGDPIYASTPQGQTTTWTVTNRRSYAYKDLPEDTFSYTGPRLLRLITCGGSDGQGHYTTNIVITCTPA